MARLATVSAVVTALAVTSCAAPVVFDRATSSSTAATRGTSEGCAVPSGSDAFTSAPPEDVDLDPAAVRDAVAFASANLASTVRIYRRNCLVATSGNDALAAETPVNLWSATKGVVSILTGRAVTLGRLGLDDPVGAHLAVADPAHAVITVRQLLTQTSGLRFAWLNEINPSLPDSVAHTLTLPFDHPPGTWFEYAQTPVTLLAAVVEAAVGQDLQDFAATELFEPLGITRDRWWWSRDVAGHTVGYASLSMRPIDLVRLGTLLLDGGRWGDRQLLDPDYVAAMSAPSPTNPGYGYLVWTNQGTWHHTASILVRQRRDRRWLPSAPPDLYALSGLGDQLVDVVPSLDLVVVRTGAFGGEGWHHEFFRRLMRGVRDAAIPDPGPFPGDLPPSFDLWKGLDPSTWPA